MSHIQTGKMPVENQFNLENISQEIEFSKKIIHKLLSEKIDIIKQIVDCQTRLTGIYSHQCFIKEFMGLKYDDNVILNNTLGNQTYLSLSILFLSENTFCGSARVLLRQFFEALLIAKYSEYDRSLIQLWVSKTEERDPSKEINLSRHVIRKLKNNRKDIHELEKTWHQLCDMAHPTKYAQQMIRVPHIKDSINRKKVAKEIISWINTSNLIPDTHYTLDLLFMLLYMNYHLLTSHLGRKAYRFYLGYTKDPFKSFANEKELKTTCICLFEQYFEINKRHKGINKILKRNIYEYRQSWK